MLKKTASMAAAVLALATIASPVMAQSFRPLNTTATLSGTLNLQQSQNIDCQVDVVIAIDGAGAATVTSRTFSPGDVFLCGGVVNPSGVWTVEAGPGTDQVTVNVGASSILGSCGGEIVAPFSGGTLSFVNATVPGSPNACIINGDLVSSPTVTIVP